MLTELLLLQSAFETEAEFTAALATLFSKPTSFGPWQDGSILPGSALYNYWQRREGYPTSTGQLLRLARSRAGTRQPRLGLLPKKGGTDYQIPVPDRSYSKIDYGVIEPPLLARLYHHLEHINFERFQIYLWYSLDSLFSTIGKEEYVVDLGYLERSGQKHKSNYWVYLICCHLIDRERIINPSTSWHFPTLVKMDGKVHLIHSTTGLPSEKGEALNKWINVLHQVYYDDLSFTGIQLHGEVNREVDIYFPDFRPRHRHVILAACGVRSKLVDTTRCVLHCRRFLPEMASQFTPEELERLLEAERAVYQRWQDMEAQDLDLRPRYLVYCDHKLADATSVPTGLIAAFVGNCDYERADLDNAHPFCPPPPYKQSSRETTAV